MTIQFRHIISATGRAILLGSVLLCGIVAIYHRPAAADAVSVTPQSPQDGYYVQGNVSFQFSTKGLAPNQYEAFWAVDNGSWNRMAQPAGNDMATAEVNVSSWNWHADNTYKLTFIALQKSNWQPVEQNLTIHIGSPLIQLLTQGTAATASVGTIASTTPVAAVARITSQATSLSGRKLYTDPAGSVAQAANAWAASHAADAAGMRYLARQPLASWFGNWNGNVRTDVQSYVDAATASDAIPVLVAYNIPNRDCGGYSAGGVTDAAAYGQWISQFAAGIGKRQALVVLEPDAIAGMDCLNDTDQAARLSMLSNAITTLKQQTDATVYLDAGNPGWHSASYMATKLKAAGVTNADGFSLNVSNYYSTAQNITYGTAVSKAVGNASHFVIDTSRNGNGTDASGAWCNPAGRVIGHAPTLDGASESGSNLVDAYLWVNVPGGSDGACGAPEEGSSAPAAGVWWPQMAREMLLNSGLM